MVCTFGLPRTMPRVCWSGTCSTIGPRPAAIASKASCQVASRSSPSVRTRGVRSRSGSPSAAPEEAPSGQMNPFAEDVVAVAAGRR